MLTDNLTAPLILVVEDDNNHAELIRRSFKDAAEEYRLEMADSLYAARSAIERHSPSLVLTDYRLPDGKGSDLVAGSWPAIMMTSQGSEQVAVEAMKLGVQDYVVKSPDTFKNMPSTVKYALTTWSLIVTGKQAADAVLKAKQDWEQTFDAVPDLIALIALDHTIIRANKAMAARCGVTIEEIVGRKCCEVMHGSSHPLAACPLARIIQDGSGCSERVDENWLNGVFDITVSPLYDSGGVLTACVHIARDVTEHKRLEEQYRQSQKIEAIGQLAGGVAHDFNNILTAIFGHAELILAKEKENAPLIKHVQEIMKASKRAADLTQGLLAFSRKQPLTLAVIDINKVVMDNEAFLRRLIREDIELKITCSEEALPVLADRGQIEQIIMNLVANGRDALLQGGRLSIETLPVTLDQEFVETHGYGTVGPYAMLSISDNGTGMDKETQSHIFEPFFTTKEPGKGTGLGLAMVYGIVKKHNGFITVYSEPGTGTIFNIYLALVSSAIPVDTQKPKEPAAPQKGTETILVCEDDANVRKLLVNILGHFGYHVIEAVDGQEAVEKFIAHQESIDLVIIDAIMPRKNGNVVGKEMKTVRPDLKMIFVSGYARDIFEGKNTFDEHTIFVQKPYSPIDLLAKVRELLDKK